MSRILSAHDRAALLQHGLCLHFMPDGPALALLGAGGPGPALVRGQASPVWRLTGKTYAADGSPMLPVPHGPNGHIAPVISRAPGIAVSRFFEDDGPDGLAGLIGFFYAMTSAWAIGDAIAKEVEPVLSEAAGRKVKVARGASEPLRFLVAFPEPRGDRIAPRTRRRTQDIWL